MSNWTDPEKWQRLVSGASCPICLDCGPRETLGEFEVCWATLGEHGPMKGYATLFFRRHVVELHELSLEEGAAFMRDIQRLSRAIQRATGAVKMNYEIHGNTLPHLHVHFFPRYPGDSFEWRPIDPRSVTESAYAPGEFEDLKRRVIEALEP